MPNSSINFSIASSAYPYVSPKVMPPVTATPPVPVALPIPITAAPVDKFRGVQGATGVQGASITWEPLTISAPDVSAILSPLNSMVNTLGSLVKVLQAVLKVIEMYLSDFSSMSKILASLIPVIDNMLESFVKNIATAGVYMNIVNVPALNFSSAGSFIKSNFNMGGYQGFLSRLQVSFDNTSDGRRPAFGASAVVGGFIVLVDAESVQDFFKALQQLSRAFNQLQGMNVSPPSPRNFKGRPGFFPKPGLENKGKLFYGIKLDWDKPAGFTFTYALSRSQTRGGVPETVDLAPSGLMGKNGLFPIVKKILATGHPYTWPKTTVKVYNDKDFNGGSAVGVTASINGGGTYIDFLDDYIDSSGKLKADAPAQLSYVVQSITLAVPSPEDLAQRIVGVGPRSHEATIALKTCVETLPPPILHREGFFEFMEPGLAPLGQWSSFEVGLMLPYVTELVGILENFVNQFGGMAASASDSFVQFGRQIVQKIEDYIGIVNIISKLITELESFIIGANVSWLYVPPAAGGTAAFMTRVKNAIVPPKIVTIPVLDEYGQQVMNLDGTPQETTTTVGFSGPSGLSSGIVMMFGAGANATQAQKLEQEAIKKVFDLISGLWK